jgi:hypothetical protein
MLAQPKRLGFLLLAGALVWLPSAAGATPLGLNIGDVVSALEWDALQDISGGPGGDGGAFTTTGANTGDTTLDGRITSVTIQGPTSNVLSGVDFQLNATLTGVTTVVFGPTVLVQLTFTGVAGDDITLTDNTGTILTAELDPSGFTIGGLYDLSGTLVDATGVANAVDITITGGDINLQNALGTAGTLDLDGTIFDFLTGVSGDLGDILANIVIDEDFTYSGTGTISPSDPAPFVPEPGTLLLVGAGLAGLAGVGSRRSRS